MRQRRSRIVPRRTTRAFVPWRLVGLACLVGWLWISQVPLTAQVPFSNQPSGINGQPSQLSLQGAPLPGAFPGQVNNQGGFNAAGAATAQAPLGTPAGPPAGTPGATEGLSEIPMTSLIGVIREGGVIMFPIIGCSFILMVFVLERLLFLRRSRIIPRSFVRGVIEQLEQGQLERDEAIALCEENGSPIADLFQAALKRYGRPAIEMEQAVLDAGERVTNSLRSYLRMFSTISNITPLLGLLGTVLGMIEAFNAISQSGAIGKPELLAGGIGQALLTTAAGLFVAIPAYTAYAYFLARADKLIIDMDTQVQRVIELVSAEGLQESGRSRSRSRRAA